MDRVRGGKADPSYQSELRKVLDNDMQRAREHRLERQLYVAQILPGAQQRVSIPIIDVLASYHIHIYIHTHSTHIQSA